MPIVAASDCVRAWPQLAATYLHAPFTARGTDGVGRSATRVALRGFFEVDRHRIVLAALQALTRQGRIDTAASAQALARYAIDADRSPPWET